MLPHESLSGNNPLHATMSGAPLTPHHTLSSQLPSHSLPLIQEGESGRQTKAWGKACSSIRGHFTPTRETKPYARALATGAATGVEQD